ncbi:MAG: hypothetical protein WA006_01890 [Rhodoglobus sp.]
MTSPSLPRLARWIVHLAAFPLTGLAAWLLAWAVSLSVAIGLEQGFVVFGSSGALAFTVLLAVTTVLVRRRAAVRA